VLGSLKLKNSKIADSSSKPLWFLLRFLLRRFKRLFQPTVGLYSSEILERKAKYHEDYKVNICLKLQFLMWKCQGRNKFHLDGSII
jgi:hypothetical protein